MTMPKYYMIDHKKAEFKLYQTVESVMDALDDCEADDRLPGEKIESVFSTIDSNGEQEDISNEKVAESIKAMGIFGFADMQNHSIHLWLDPDLINQGDLIYFLGHELGHMAPLPNCFSSDPVQANIEEETRAEWFAAVAHEAYQLAFTIMAEVNAHRGDEAGDTAFNRCHCGGDCENG